LGAGPLPERNINNPWVARAVWIAAGIGLALVVLVLYGRSIDYGLIWDDPHWFRQGAGLSLADLLRGTERYQFYRPLSLLYFQQWWRTDGSLDIRGLHAAEVAYHLLATWLTLALARAWGADRITAAVAALLFAVFPFSQQAVAWAAPQQPLVTALLLASAVALSRSRAPDRGSGAVRDRWSVGWFLLAAGCYAAALLVQEVAVAFALLLAFLAWRGGERRWRLARSAVFPVLARVRGVRWWFAPRRGGGAGGGLDPWVAAFLVQATAFPVVRVLAATAVGWPSMVLIALGIATCVFALLLLVRRGARDLAILAAAWVVLALLPVWVGLGRDYVEVGQRLVYPAVPGIALLWAGVAGLGLRARRTWVRGVAAVVVAAVLGRAVLDVVAQNRLLASGSTHLAEAIEVAGRPRTLSVFVNFPDRYFLRRPPYPLGDWGLPLAPVVMDVADFARAATGQAGADESWSVPRIGAAERAAWPYRVDMRGVIVDAAGLREIAERADGIYLSDYQPNGTLRLRPVGGLGPDAAPEVGDATVSPIDVHGEPVATFGNVAVLRAARLRAIRSDLVRLRLTWQVRGEFEQDDTVFVHVFGADGRQVLGEDGDGWGGLLPLVDWPTNRLLTDARTLEIGGLPAGTYRVTVGLYHRPTNARYRAATSDGRRFRDDEVDVGTLHLP